MISDVEMVNWRAFERKKFTFKPGLNFIMGPNGKGKTSILEAIAYALTGEPSVVNDRDELLRNPEKPATVRLTFKVNDQDYLIERTQQPGRAGDARMVDLLSKKVLAASHKGVTEKVERLTGVSVDFLRRIVYMAEGDVFRFLKDPPGKAMNQQVQQVLGLTQMDQFQEGIKQAQKDLRSDSKDLKTLQQRVEALDISATQTLEGMIAYLDDHRNRLMGMLLKLQDELTHSREQAQSVTTLDQNIARNITRLQLDSRDWERAQNLPLASSLELAEADIQRLEGEIQQGEKGLAGLGERKENCRRILELLSGPGQEKEEVACPVCKKPMTPTERQAVNEETMSLVRSIDAETETLVKKIDESRSALQQVEAKLDSLREIRNGIVHGRLGDFSVQMSIGQMQAAIERSREKPAQAGIEEQIGLIQGQVNDLEKARANFISVYNQLQERGFSSPGDIQESLVQIETRLLTLAAAKEAAEATLADLRDGRLGSIYQQITSVWNNFIQHGQWHLRFDADGLPRLEEEDEREFGFSQFSGGEKTALLVIIHTVIAHHFSNCKFLLVDEPLEHLDPVNRRSLMRFFMAASQNKFFEQALISTYEESLVRKYISEENVNIIHII